jgi:Sec-independent protein translocase protein TatA
MDALFGIGGMELLLILLITLVVAGPRRMLHWAYLMGKYMGKLRVMWGEMMEVLQKEFDEAGVDVKVPKEPPTRRDLDRYANEALRPFREPMQKAMDEYEKETRDLTGSVKDAVKVDLEDNGSQRKPGTRNPAPTPRAARPAARKPAPAPKNNFGAWSGATDNDKKPGPQGDFGTWSAAGNAKDRE